MSATEFLAACDFLFTHRTDYATAYREFRWPVLDKFNWALDYFDRMAHGDDRPALWIVNEGGQETIARSKSRSPRWPSAPAASPTTCAVWVSGAATACC
jgi:hypothetical protein